MSPATWGSTDGGPSLKANWFVAELDVSATDPFEGPIEEIAAVIDLRQPDLVMRLAELVHEEAELGISCPIRARAGSICSACPVSEAAHTGGRSALCRNGAEQERVLCTMAVVEERDAGHP
jgi:hypothetical protein